MFYIKFMYVLISIFIVTAIISNAEEVNKNKMILGGSYIEEDFTCDIETENDNMNQYYSLERFFRPSNMIILNDKRENKLYDFYRKKYSEISLPKDLMKTPEDTIINYFSILREAANPLDDTKTGCGSLGDGKAPYPIAYNFFTNSYKSKYSYKDYLKSFENKLHINLIKMNKVAPDENKPNDLKYFVELEVIEGSSESIGLFAYYYGYIYLEKEENQYKIKDMKYLGENYLCAPYHGWRYDAESFISIEYGDWCSLVDGEINIDQNGYEKKAYFKDKNKNEYYVLFYQLTNGVDIKIADYKKNKNGKWELIYIYPEKCLDNKKNLNH